jgi:hypothetical protein
MNEGLIQAGAHRHFAVNAPGARAQAQREIEALIPAQARGVQWFNWPADRVRGTPGCVAAKWLQPVIHEIHLTGAALTWHAAMQARHDFLAQSRDNWDRPIAVVVGYDDLATLHAMELRFLPASRYEPQQHNAMLAGEIGKLGPMAVVVREGIGIV